MSTTSSFMKQQRVWQLTPLLWNLIALLAALAGGYLLFISSINTNLTSTIIEIGLDPLRAQLTTALVLTVGTALMGAFIGRRKVGAVLGAGVVFCLEYLLVFIRLERQPVYDPGGHLERLNSGALLHTSVVLAALALLCAFIGAAVGVALGSVLLDPPFLLFRLVLERRAGQRVVADKTRQSEPRKTLASFVLNWLGAVVIVVLIVLASSSSNLFLFSPDVGLHVPPQVSGHTEQGTIIQSSLVSSALNGQEKPFLIYLPPSYNTAVGRTKHYPTLYLLHGSPGKDDDWVTGGKATASADTLIATGKIPELIMILPDGNGRPGAPSEWGNSYNQRQRIETYVTTDLVNYIDKHYRTIADAAHRAIGGLSMGGFGAMNIAVHHPDVFGTVIALGGYYRATGSVWGNNAAYIQANSPEVLMPKDKQAWKLHIYLGAATNDQPYYNDTKQFAQELHTLHIPYTFDLQQGYHSWHVWQVQMYNALTWLQWS
ncbi:MAG: hypothetical protein NVSMB49_24930 [Ktedonobacteraceae bacterium]